MSGYDKSPDYGVNTDKYTAKDWIGVWLIGIIITSVLGFIVISGLSATAKEQPYPVITSIYWSDGDSGRINGTLKFRLANIDAPETGSLKQRGGAKCEAERKLGYAAKAFMVGLTKGAALRIERDQGLDRYGRLVLDLSANGVSVAQSGISSGNLRPWPHKGRKAVVNKPQWCGVSRLHYTN